MDGKVTSYHMIHMKNVHLFHNVNDELKRSERHYLIIQERQIAIT